MKRRAALTYRRLPPRSAYDGGGTPSWVQGAEPPGLKGTICGQRSVGRSQQWRRYHLTEGCAFREECLN